jgi:hypothetical protein
MDTNTILIIINVVLQIFTIIDKSILKRLKKSSCLGLNIELNNNNDDVNNKTQDKL